VKERPILFTGAMVRALLAGTKTQTRRPLYVATKNVEKSCFDNRYRPTYGNGEWPNLPVGSAWTLSQWRKAQPGDRLWVREAWRASSAHDDLAPCEIPQGDAIEFGADPERVLTGKLRPSIHMPRWASRITREVVSVRVERLQAISEEDAIAEGIERQEDGYGWKRGPVSRDHPNTATRTSFPRLAFQSIWEQINGPDSWHENPWVLRIEFKQLEKA